MAKLTLGRIWLAGILLFVTVQGLACGWDPLGLEHPCPTGTTGGPATVSFSKDIAPMLIISGCLFSSCHGGTFSSSGYDMRTYDSCFASGDNAARFGICEIVPGDPASSFLIEKLRQDEPRIGLRMPLGRDFLTEEQISMIETWIREGAQNN